MPRIDLPGATSQRERPSDLAFYWTARDKTLDPRTGQKWTLQYGPGIHTGAAIGQNADEFDIDPFVQTGINYPRFSANRNGLGGYETVLKIINDYPDNQTYEKLAYDWENRQEKVGWSFLTKFYSGYGAGDIVSGNKILWQAGSSELAEGGTWRCFRVNNLWWITVANPGTAFIGTAVSDPVEGGSPLKILVTVSDTQMSIKVLTPAGNSSTNTVAVAGALTRAKWNPPKFWFGCDPLAPSSNRGGNWYMLEQKIARGIKTIPEMDLLVS